MITSSVASTAGTFEPRISIRGKWISQSTEHEQEEDGRWIAEAPEVPGTLAYGATGEEAIARVEALVLRVLADRIEHGE